MASVATKICMNGTTRQAVELYQRVFGARVLFLVTYGETEPELLRTVPTEEQKDLIYHAEIFLHGHRIIFYDTLLHNAELGGHNPYLQVSFDTGGETRRAYEMLREDCMASLPLEEKFYASLIGRVTDRFGVTWGLICEKN